MIDFKRLLKAGVHFGHQVTRWSPKMKRYIWGEKNGVSLIDISQTAIQLEKAKNFIKEITGNGGTVLWVGTKKPAKKAINQAAEKTGMPWVSHRWIGGTLSNFSQVKKSVTKLLHLEDSLNKTDSELFITKKELSVMRKTVDRLHQNIGGIRKLAWPINVIVVVDVKKESSAVREARRMGVPVIGIVDTNSDPSMIDYVIPSNDDAPQAIELLIDELVAAAEEGIEVAKKEKAAEIQKKKEAAAAKAKEAEETAKKKSAVKKAPVKKASAVKNSTAEESPKAAKKAVTGAKKSPVVKAEQKEAASSTKKKETK